MKRIIEEHSYAAVIVLVVLIAAGLALRALL